RSIANEPDGRCSRSMRPVAHADGTTESAVNTTDPAVAAPSPWGVNPARSAASSDGAPIGGSAATVINRSVRAVKSVSASYESTTRATRRANTIGSSTAVSDTWPVGGIGQGCVIDVIDTGAGDALSDERN